MALFEENEPSYKIAPIVPSLVTEGYKSHTVDTKYEPLGSLMVNIPGYPRVVDYYAAVIASDDPLEAVVLERSPVHQQLHRIRAFEIKVENPDTRTQDEQTKEFVVQGSAYVFPCLIPNKGDAFIADIGDGKAGFYTVTNTERLSHFSEPVHRIEYRLISALDNPILFDLERKVVKTSHFRREYLDYQQSPLIEDQHIHWVRELEVNYKKFSDEYFDQFWSREFATLIVPGQEEAIYDPFVTRVMTDMCLTSNSEYYRNLRILNVSEEDHYRSDTILDVIKDRKDFDLLSIIRKCRLVYARSFSATPYFSTIHYSGISHVVYPNDDSLTSDYQLYGEGKPIDEFKMQNKIRRVQDFEALCKVNQLPGFNGDPKPLLHPVLIDDYYVFSESFYKNTKDQSHLEEQVRLYLNHESPNPIVIKELMKTYRSWGVLEKFYYTPALLTLIFALLRSF